MKDFKKGNFYIVREKYYTIREKEINLRMFFKGKEKSLNPNSKTKGAETPYIFQIARVSFRLFSKILPKLFTSHLILFQTELREKFTK